MFDYQSKSFDLNHVHWNRNPKTFDIQRLIPVLPYAVFNDEVRLSFKNTFAIADIRGLNITAKSLIIDSQRGIMTTTHTSAMLIKALTQTLLYEGQRSTMMAAGILGESRTKLPVIQNNFILCPLGAVSRHSTSWVSMHGLSGMQRCGKGTVLEFAHEIKLTIPNSFSAMKAQFNKARRIQAELHKMAQQETDDPLMDARPIPNLALNPKLQAQMYTSCGCYLLKKYGIEADIKDVKFYQRQFFGKV